MDSIEKKLAAWERSQRTNKENVDLSNEIEEEVFEVYEVSPVYKDGFNMLKIEIKEDESRGGLEDSFPEDSQKRS